MLSGSRAGRALRQRLLLRKVGPFLIVVDVRPLHRAFSPTSLLQLRLICRSRPRNFRILLEELESPRFANGCARSGLTLARSILPRASTRHARGCRQLANLRGTGAQIQAKEVAEFLTRCIFSPSRGCWPPARPRVARLARKLRHDEKNFPPWLNHSGRR